MALGFYPINGYSQNINIEVKTSKSVSVEAIFDLIKSNTDYKFIYRSDLIKNAPKVYLKKGKLTVEHLLEKALKNVACSFQFSKDNTIVLKKKQISKLPKKKIQQKNITITGYILNSATKQPLAYVNIGFIKKGIGTVSNENGLFHLTFKAHKIDVEDILQISSIGFETIKLKTAQFYGSIAKSNKIYLKPEPFALDAVVLNKTKRRQKLVGSSKKKDNSIGYWLNSEALGGEIATKININHANSKLHYLKFHVIKNNSGSIKIRINVYDFKDGIPGKNLLKRNIYHTISRPFGEEIIDLKPHNIVVHNNVIVSMELVQVFGTFIDFEVAASRFNGISFTRHLSQDKWKKYDNLMAFSLNTSYPVKMSADKEISRDLPKKITLYWDTSLKMKSRKSNQELYLLNRYLNKLKNAEVRVITFNSMPQKPKNFSLRKGNSDAIINYLKATHNDGASNYADILKTNQFQAETILVFTDGNSNFEALKQLVYVPTFYINSITDANHFTLQKEASYADGHYINLLKQDSKSALKLMLNEIEDKNIYIRESPETKGLIYGKISSDSLIIHKAKIRIKNSLKEVLSDKDGNYKIEAKEGDILIVSAFGMLNREVPILKKSKNDINLKADGEVLEEILLQAESKKEAIIDTPYGEKSFDAVTFAFDAIKKEDIKPEHHHLDQIVSKIPGLIISGQGNRKRYTFSRTIGSSFNLDYNPIIVIDDIIYSQVDGLDNLPPIDIQSIESVVALKSVMSTNKYGSSGAYGAIVIKTMSTATQYPKGNKNKPSALISGNDYIENLPLINSLKEHSKYILQLEKATTHQEAIAIYNVLREQIKPIGIPFYLDAATYFMKWDNDFAFNILTNVLIIAKDNPKALKALAYKLDALGKFKAAASIYKQIALLRPQDAQSYRDLALNYKNTGAYTKAINLYKQMLNNTIKGTNFNSITPLIVNELKHLIALHGSKVDSNGLPDDFLKADFKYDVRIVFNWNDPNAEFEVQFVNPNKKFYNWNLTKFDNHKRLLDGITNGYHIKEFIIDEDEAGEWLINIRGINEESQLNPTYLKYTVFRNYGLPNESKEVKITNLKAFGSKVTLDKLLNQ